MEKWQWGRCAVTGKRGYDTRRKSEAVRKRHSESAVLHSYRCPDCGMFHVGHRLGWKRSPST